MDARVWGSPETTPPAIALLAHLESLTFPVETDDGVVSAVSVYSEPITGDGGAFQPVVAAETGFEGVACLDDTARAAILALDVHATYGDERALRLATSWLSFVNYMQYPDGSFGNFIRNSAGTRNASSQTSLRGGYWWSGRALWALGRGFAVTHDDHYRDRFRSCPIEPILDGKISSLLALGELELYAGEPEPSLRDSILANCHRIISVSGRSRYLRDQPGIQRIHLWGYHQIEALARAGAEFMRPDFIDACEETVRTVIEPAVRAGFWHTYPGRSKHGVCAYDVSPAVRGLSALYHATDNERYRALALEGCAWLYGRNDAAAVMYDPLTGRCRDGINHGRASENFGAESSIEGGFIELVRRGLHG